MSACPSLGFNLFPFLGTGGNADHTLLAACAPTPTLTELSQTLYDNQMLYLAGHPGQNNSAAPNISCQEEIKIMPDEEGDDDWESASDFSSDVITHRHGPSASAPEKSNG